VIGRVCAVSKQPSAHIAILTIVDVTSSHSKVIDAGRPAAVAR
jgi:hypothetical protein